jgi:hypothetical protein
LADPKVKGSNPFPATKQYLFRASPFGGAFCLRSKWPRVKPVSNALTRMDRASRTLTVALGRCDDGQMAAYTDTEPSRCGSTSSRQDLMLDRHHG